MALDVREPLRRVSAKGHQGLLERYDPDLHIRLLDGEGTGRSYHFIPNEIRQIWKSIEQDFGTDGFDIFQRVTLLRLIGQFDKRRRRQRYTEAVLERFEVAFKRIIKCISDAEYPYYRSVNDILLKDLGLCRQILFPTGGARVVESDTGFHRAMVYRSGIGQAKRFVQLLLTAGGHKHWYQTHVHSSELDEFSEEGWVTSLRAIADMLALNPQVRGVWGGSWYFDPLVTSISPRLAYLRRIPEQNGAYFFYSNIDVNSGALSTSETRRRAYANGNYVPKTYVMCWPRRSLLKWLRGPVTAGESDS